MENEKRLIDANKLNVCYINTGTVMFPKMEAFVRADDIADAPTVDAVEVVRCEKCLYRSQYCDENGFYKCGGIQNEDGTCFLMVEPTHFCAFGKWRGKLGARMD